MNGSSLQAKIENHGSALGMLRTAPTGPYQFPIAAQFSNWREEQRAWREGVAFMDQSFHMTDLYIEGPDAVELVKRLSINSYEHFGENKAKQMVACAPDGRLIGDMILFGLGKDVLNVVGRPSVANWIEFNAGGLGLDVRCSRDERTLQNRNMRRTFRFEIQGPGAWELIEQLNGEAMSLLKFFHMGRIRVGAHEFGSLRHGMGGAPGLEFWGPFELYDEVKGIVLEAGREFGICEVGARAYSSAAVDSGWLASPLPAIYSGQELQDYREWLPATSFDATADLGGSFVSERIEDYYFTPWDLDYGRLIKFDHDFVGRGALENLLKERHRRKVSLVIDPSDATAVYASQMEIGRNGKGMELPSAHYATYPYDAVIGPGGRTIGVSTYMSFLAPDGAWVSLAVVDEDFASEGTELTVLWGEPGGGSGRPTVEPHVQMPLRCTVASWPISKLARQDYRCVPRSAPGDGSISVSASSGGSFPRGQ